MSSQQKLNQQIEQVLNGFMSALGTDDQQTVSGSFAALLSSDVGNHARQAGEQAPDFSLPSVTGDRIHLYDLLQHGPAVVSFFRGGWCPFCDLELRALQQRIPEIRSLNAQLIAISPEIIEIAKDTAQNRSLDFPVLSDAGNAVARSYGLLMRVDPAMRPLYRQWGFDLPEINGDDSWELPLPATYIIDMSGEIRSAHIDKNYTRRMEPAAIIETLAVMRNENAGENTQRQSRR